MNTIPVKARHTDPPTSQEAASALQEQQPLLARCIQTVVAILTLYGRPLTDFEIRECWPVFWKGPFYDSLPTKARLWAMNAGKIAQAGYGHRGRRWVIGRRWVKLWALAPAGTPRQVVAVKCTPRRRIKELEQTINLLTTESARLKELSANLLIHLRNMTTLACAETDTRKLTRMKMLDESDEFLNNLRNQHPEYFDAARKQL